MAVLRMLQSEAVQQAGGEGGVAAGVRLGAVSSSTTLDAPSTKEMMQPLSDPPTCHLFSRARRPA